MKIDFSQAIFDLEDKETGLTLGSASIQAMMTPVKGDEEMTAGEKVRLFDIALKIKGGTDDLPVEDVAFVKARIGLLFAPLVVGRAYAMLA